MPEIGQKTDRRGVLWPKNTHRTNAEASQTQETKNDHKQGREREREAVREEAHVAFPILGVCGTFGVIVFAHTDGLKSRERSFFFFFPYFN